MLTVRPVKIREAPRIECRQAAAIVGWETRETIDGGEEASADRNV
jgi:hypothetical protein